MKKLITLLMALVFIMPDLLGGTGTVTLGNETTSNTTTGHPTPYGTYYKNHRVQYLVLAGELASLGLAPGDITAIGFDVANVNNCNAMPNYTMMVKFTDANVLTTTFDNDGFTTVWTSEEFLPVNGWNTHTFSTPMNWDGESNLLIDVCFDLVETYSQNASVYYTATATNLTNYYRNDINPACGTSALATVSKNRANIQITGELADCAPPSQLTATEITAHTALIGWTPVGSEISWNLAYGEAGFDPQEEGEIFYDVTYPYLLEGLEGSSQYDVYVQSVCDDDSKELSLWAGPVTFTTLCVPMSTFPWTESFEDVLIPDFPICWFKESGNWVTTNNANSTYDADARTGTQFLRERYSASNSYMWTPGFVVEAGVSYDFSFWWAGDTYAGWDGDVFFNHFQTSEDAIHIETFVESSTITTKTYAQFLYTFIPDEDGIYYFAIRINSTSSPWYLSFDDFRFEPTPSCVAPTNLAVSEITQSGAKIDWTPGGDEEIWNLLYGEAGFDPEEEGTLVENITTNSYTITGLSSSTQYQVYVQANCNGDNSPWAGPLAFLTECGSFTLPFAEDFTGVTVGTLPNCWSVSGEGQTNWSVQNTTNAGGTAPEMRLYWSPSFVDLSRLVTPILSAGDANNFIVSFDQKLDYFAAFEGAYIAVEYSVDLGENWEIIYQNFFSSTFGPNTEEFDFSIPEDTDEFNLAFTFYGDIYNINGWYIDNIYVDSFIPANLSGNVSGGRGPIEGARVFTEGYEAFTDESGNYEILEIQTGFYDISCEAEGFLTKLVEDFELDEGNNTLDFVLNFAQIAVDPESFEVEILPGGQKTEMLNISNPAGTGPLTWNATVSYESNRTASSVQPFTYGEIVETNNTDKSKDACETTTTVSGGQTRDTWDILQSFSVSAGGEQGIATDGEYIYTAFWGTNGKFGKYTLAGEFIETFTIANVGGIRDLTYDGTYFYGGAGTTTIYKLDFAKKTLEGTITSPVAVRHLSYDPVEDAFWCGDWTSLRLVSRAGTTLVTGPTLVSVYGSAYDGNSEGGPYLWFFSQTAVAGYGTEEDRVMIQQFNIATNSLTGVFHCAIDIPGYQAEGIAGGAFATDLLIPGKYVLMVNVQATPNLVGVYELSPTYEWLDLSAYNGVIQPIDDQDIQVNFNTAGLEEGTYNATIKITHDGQNVTKGLVEIPVTMHVYPPCPKPVDLTVDNITQTSAVLNWTAIGEETTWNLKYGDPGFDPETEGTFVGGIAKPYLLEGLNHSSDYAFRVQAVCDDNELSDWSLEKKFSTLCGANELPFVEDFEGVGFPPKCWNIYDLDGGGTQWVVLSAQNHTPGGSKSAYHQWASGDQDGWLVTPQIQLPEDLDINLSFWSFNLYPGDYGQNSVLISTGSGDPDDEEFELLWSPETVTQPWEETLIPLTDYAGEVVYIAFRYTGDNAHGWFVDDVQVFVPGNVEGYVSEATSPKNRTPIEGARVFTAHYEAFTDASGYYKLEGLPAGFYDISCEAQGYFTSVEENFEIVEDDTKSLNFTLDFAQIAVDPDEFDIVLPHESIKIEKLTISNPGGTGPLTWNAQISFNYKRDSYQHFNFSSNYNNNFKTDALLSGNSHTAATPTREYSTCPEGSLFGFEPDFEDWAIVTSEEDPGYVAFQYFSDVSGLIGGITFWGGNLIYDGGWNACNDEDPMPFVIEFYTDDNGVPGDFVTSFSASISRVDTQIPIGAYGNFYLYSLEFDEAVALSSGWVAIQGQTSTPDCWFMWAGTYEGVGTPYLQWDGEGLSVGDYALSMCLTEFVGSDVWLSLNNYSGVIQPNDNQDIQVIFNSSDLEEGDYHATIKINHDGQEVGKGQVQVPVTMGVYPYCPKPKDLTAILVNPTAFDLGWTPMGETSVFNVLLTDEEDFVIGGEIQPYDSFEGIEDNPLFVEDLEPETDYWFYVQADCGETEFDAPKVNRYWLDINTQGDIGPANSGGTANEIGEDGTWYFYNDPETEQSWYSVWFYNNSLDMYGMNKMKMGFYVQKGVPFGAANVSFAVSYSDPEWDPETPEFPMPDDEEFILRSTLNGPYSVTGTATNKQWFELEFDIPDYNPEWISVNIFGSNIKIDNTTWTKPSSDIGLDEYWDINATGCGIIVHESLPKTKSAWVGPKKFTTLPLCPTPTNLTVSDITTTSAVFDWDAGFNETTWNLKYYEVGVGDTVFANSITKPYPCTDLTPNTNYAFMVQADCGGGDVSAWAAPKAFSTPCEAYPLPFAEDFTDIATNSIPECWTRDHTNWGVVASANAGGTSPEMRFNWSPSLDGLSRLITPPISTENASEFMISFDQYLNDFSTYTGEYIAIEYSIDNGDNWVEIWHFDCEQSIPATLTEIIFEIPAKADKFLIAFVFNGNSYNINYWYFDNIVIDVAPTCFKPTDLDVTDITQNSAVLGWTPGGNETKWNLKYGEPGFNPETEGTLISGITTNPFLLEGLNSSTAYAFSVQADCGEGDVSFWSVKKTFATLCAPVNLPYIEGFDNVTAPAIPHCMTVTDDNGDDKLWVTSTSYPRSTPNSMYMTYNTSLAMNDWFFTPGLILTGGKTYIVEFYYRGSGASFPEKLEVKWGTNPNAAGMTGEQIWNNSSITNSVYALATAGFTPDEDGVYYVGWHGYSDADMYYLCVDDISITAAEEPGPPQNQTVSGSLADCYDALEVITIENAQVEEGNIAEFRAGETINATDFTVEEDAVAYLYAGQNIVLGEGVHVAQGADFLATIMDEITYCEQAATMVTAKSEEIAPAVITPAEMDAMFTIYPNPTTGRFTLLMKEADESSVINVEIFGLMGERVLQTQLFGQNQYEFDLSGSPKGVYIVRVLNGKQTSIEKLIKQ
jgi:hypothetical protein